MKKFWLLLSILFLWTCGGGGSKTTGPEEPPIVINLTSLTGQAQKGPFNNGTAINVAELTSALSPTGRNFSSAITDNTGRFSVANVQLESPYVELRANGFYFNEVSNELSEAQLTLYALSNLTGKNSLNVNIITHLEKNRMVTLMSGDTPKTFAQAKLQAQEEVFAIFDYSRANVPESELLDISQGGAANGKLLAMSAILQGDLTVAQMSQLLANISTDIASDGTLDDTSLRATLINNSKNLDMAAIRVNIEDYYISLGVTATIPDFETEINQFLKPPVSQDITASTTEDTAINITLSAADPEGESLTYTILEVNNATVTLSGNVANYTPDANFNGTDTFTYKANDGTSDSNIATVTMTVSAEDDEPNTNNVSTTTDEDTAVVINLTADEYDGDSYSFAIVTDVSNGTVSLSGTTATYTPNQDWNGTDTFTFEATDDRTARTNVATATITVNAVNDAPASSEVSGSSDEDTAIDIALSATDVDQDNLTYSIVSDVSNGTTSISGSTLTYTPNQDWNGTDTFTYKVNDGTVDSNTSNGTITIAAVNDAPVANDVTISTNETRFISVNITLDATDVDGDNLTYTIVSDASNATMSLNDNVITYVPTTDWNGEDSFTYKANDGTVDSNTATVTITVNAVNDTPVAPDATKSTNEDTEITIGFDLGGATGNSNHVQISDVDSDSGTVSIVSSPSNGTIGVGSPSNGGFIGNGAVSVGVSYTPDANWNGTDTFTYKFNDGELDSNIGTITITVTAVNDAPVVEDKTVKYNKNTTADPAFDASDIDGDALTYSIVSQPSNGSVSIRSDGGGANYVPNTDFTGSDSFTFKGNDGFLDSNIGTMTIIVNAPPEVSNQSIAFEKDTSITFNLSSSDEEGDTLTYQIFENPSNGSVSINGFDATYTPNSGLTSNDSFKWQAYDGTGWSDIATVTLQYSPAIIFERTYSMGNNQSVAMDLKIASDGGYIITGYTRQYGVNNSDVFILKTDNNGNLEWNNTFAYNSSIQNHNGDEIQETSDGGYIIVGGADYNAYIVKVDSEGNKQWDKVYSDIGATTFQDSRIITGKMNINETSDGGYFISIYDPNYNHDAFKIDSSGNLLWTKSAGSGTTLSTVSNNELVILADASITFFDSDGNLSSVSTFDEGGGFQIWHSSFEKTSDGGFVLGGATNSYDATYNDAYLVKFDSSGSKAWHKTFIYSTSSETPFEENGSFAIETSDGNYLLIGNNFSTGELFIFKSDSDAGTTSENAKIWQKKIKYQSSETMGNIVREDSNGEYIIAGSVGSTTKDVFLIKIEE
jgi:hypothetical protein